MDKLFSLSKDGNIYKNYKAPTINHSLIKEETNVLVERMVRKNILEPKEVEANSNEWNNLFQEDDINPNDHYSPKDLKGWSEYLINSGFITDPEDLDQSLAGLRLILGDKTEYDYSPEKGDLIIKPAGSIKISPSQHRKIMIKHYTGLRDKTPLYIDKNEIREHIGGVSLSTIDKLMTEGLPYVKIAGTRRVGFCKKAVNRYLKENS